jgi:hypothetical protein
MFTTAIVIASWIAGYVVLRWVLQRSMARLRSEFKKSFDQQFGAQSSLSLEGAAEGKELRSDLSPGSVSALGQSLSALIGQPVHIHSIKKVQATHSLSNAWAREGCVLVQNSHSLRVHASKVTAEPVVHWSSDEVARRTA